MKRIYVFLFSIIVTVASGCSSLEDVSVSCLGEQCASQECIDKQVMKSKDGMIDFCQSPAFGTFAIEKDGITWYFSESVSYGKFVNGDYWVLDKGDGITVTKVTPGPQDGRHGSMINPIVGSQAYDTRAPSYDESRLVTYPATLKAGDSLVSSISIVESDLNSSGKYEPTWYSTYNGISRPQIKSASVLTVVSEVPATGSFRPPYIGSVKKFYNISDINKGLLKNYPAPPSLPDIGYLEHGLERPWLMHLSYYKSQYIHPAESMRNYYRDIGNFLSEASLVLLTDAVTPKLLYGFIQTGIDHYYTIINGYGPRATFEFQSIFTGMLLSDEEMANVWVDGRSKTPGRGSKFTFVRELDDKELKSSIVPSGQTWHGFNVAYVNASGSSHEQVHPSEWDMVGTAGGKKQEDYRHCCGSVPSFGMAITSKGLSAGKYWPTNALDQYLDRWVWESKNGYGLDVIQQYYPAFQSSKSGAGSRDNIVGNDFNDAMYLLMGFNPNGVGPTFGKDTGDSSTSNDSLQEETSKSSENTTDASLDTTEDTSSETLISNQIEDTRVITEETTTAETTTDPVEENTTTETTTDPVGESTTTETTTDPVEETTSTEATTDPVEESTTSETTTDPIDESTTTEAITDPIDESTTTEATTDPVEESTTSETATDPVEETTTSGTTGGAPGGSTLSTSGGSSTTGTSSDTVDETSTSKTPTTAVDESQATEEPLSTEGDSTTDTSLDASGDTQGIDLTGGTIDEGIMEDVLTTDTTESTSDSAGSEDNANLTTDETVVKEDSIKTKRSNKIKDERGLPPGRNKK